MVAPTNPEQVRRFTVVIEPTEETDQPGWFYAHIPALDLTTHGQGVEGALAAARELITGWAAELRAEGKPVPCEPPGLVAQVEVALDAIHGE